MSIEVTCPACSFSKKIPRDKFPSSAKWATCPRCGRRFQIFSADRSQGPDFTKVAPDTHQPTVEGKVEKDSIRNDSPWENRDTLGLWEAIYTTIKSVMFSPDIFFRSLTTKGGLLEPLAFGLLTGAVGAMFGVFWQFLMASGRFFSMGDFIAGQISFGIIFLVTLVFVPIAVVAGQFVSSVVWHLFLLLLRGANNGFEATFRVVSYSQSVLILSFIPVIGGWISGIWQLVIQIIGLKEIHETSYLKVISAFLIPLAIFAFFIMIVIILLIGFFSRQNPV